MSKIVKNPPQIEEMIDEFNQTYEEWIEMGYPVEYILVSLLHKERQKNFDLKMTIDRLEKQANATEY